MSISKYGQNGAHDRSYLGVKSCKTSVISLMKQVLVYPKIIFIKNREQTMRHLQFKFDPFSAEQAGICLFGKGWMESFSDTTIWLFVHEMWSNILEKMVISHFATYFWQMLHKKTYFSHSENEKWFFCAMKMKTFFGNIVPHSNMHSCAQYGTILTNYATIIVITLVIWSESHESSYMRGYFSEHFLKLY